MASTDEEWEARSDDGQGYELGDDVQDIQDDQSQPDDDPDASKLQEDGDEYDPEAVAIGAAGPVVSHAIVT